MTASDSQPWFVPAWPAPAGVHSLITTRQSGRSVGCYASNNLGTHVGDRAACVEQNRRHLKTVLPEEPYWLNQVHGTVVIDTDMDVTATPEADASFADRRNRVCAVLTADCLPVLLCSTERDEIAAVHAGWRGLAGGVIQAAVKRFKSPPKALMAYLGPAISQAHFEVGEEVLQAFQWAARQRPYASPVEDAFVTQPMAHKYRASLHYLARSELLGLGVQKIYAEEYCTYRDSDLFYSFRRDNTTGRFASLIWLD